MKQKPQNTGNKTAAKPLCLAHSGGGREVHYCYQVAGHDGLHRSYAFGYTVGYFWDSPPKKA
jgi:hypothetical protein